MALFKGPSGATPRRSNFNRLWHEAVVAAGIAPDVGLHVHDLRHTGNTLTRGASLKDVMRRLGHASTRAALIYQHADRESASGRSRRGCRRRSGRHWPSRSGTCRARRAPEPPSEQRSDKPGEAL
jgi:Phage integrase family